MLRERLGSFLEICEPDEKPQALRAVSHLIFLGDYKRYRDLIKGLSDNSHELFYREVRDFIKYSFECRKVWRSVFAFFQGQGLSLLDSAIHFQADPKDISFLWRALTSEDRQEIRIAASNEEAYELLSEKEFVSLISRLDKYCGKVSYLKLRFLSDNDCSIDLEDLRGELLAHAIQVVRVYEHFGNLKKIENFAKRGVSNYAINLIQFHTSESRARVTNNTKGCGTCIFCLVDKPQKCKHAVADYRNTTLSLQGLSLEGGGFSPRSPVSSDRRVSDASFVKFMKAGVDDSSSKVIDLIVNADPDDEFEQWLSLRYQTTVDRLLSNPRRLVRLLCEYLDVSHKDVTQSLRTQYSKYHASV